MILYALRYYPTLTETFAHDEIRALRALGLSVEVAAFGARADPGVEPPDFPVHAAPHRWGWLRWLPWIALEFLRQPARWLDPDHRDRRVLWLAALLRRGGTTGEIRAVHVHFAGEGARWTQLACARVAVPFGVTLHAADLFKPHPRLAEILAAAAWRVTISAHNAAWIAARYAIPPDQLAVIPCGVDPDRLTPAPAPAGEGTASDPPELLFVGRNVPKKGLDLLLHAIRALSAPLTLRLISDHPPVDDPRVIVEGLRPRAEVYARMRQARAFVLPCRRGPDGDMDGIPVVLLEAMALGVPVITTAISGIPEVVDEAVGWLVPPEDEAALHAAIIEALADPAEAARRGAAGRARVLAGRTLAAQAGAMRAIFARGGV